MYWGFVCVGFVGIGLVVFFWYLMLKEMGFWFVVGFVFVLVGFVVFVCSYLMEIEFDLMVFLEYVGVDLVY